MSVVESLTVLACYEWRPYTECHEDPADQCSSCTWAFTWTPAKL